MSNKEWDSPLEEEERQEFKDLPKGEYRFAVKSLTKRVSSGNKTNGAPMASLEFFIFPKEACEGRESVIGIGFDNLIRHTSTDWKVCAFFTAIGDRKHDEVVVPNWDNVPGAEGRAIFVPETYEGKISMKVEKYLPPIEVQAGVIDPVKEDDLQF